MTRLFVFESLSAGPCDGGSAALSIEASLLREGFAMLSALADDLAAVESVDVTAIVDGSRVPHAASRRWNAVIASNPGECTRSFDRLAADADWTLIIAPEIDRELARLCRRVIEVGGRLLGPSADAVELLGDKHRTAEFLAARGVPVCGGTLLAPGSIDRGVLADFPFPAVVKPIDGAGSLGVRLFRTANELEASSQPRRLERFAPGVAVSAAVLCGPSERCVLPPCSQRLSADGRFAYLGGAAPLPRVLAMRARSLTERVLATIPELLGYVGVDMVLGDDPAGAGDVVIEINPRPTTSYVGLRRLAETNLAAAMLDLAAGRSPGALSFRPGRVEFDSSGTAVYRVGEEFAEPATPPIFAAR